MTTKFDDEKCTSPDIIGTPEDAKFLDDYLNDADRTIFKEDCPRAYENPLPVGLEDRELFHRLLNLDFQADRALWYKKAQEYVDKYMKWAEVYLDNIKDIDCKQLGNDEKKDEKKDNESECPVDDTDDIKTKCLDKEFPYSLEAFKERMDKIYKAAYDSCTADTAKLLRGIAYRESNSLNIEDIKSRVMEIAPPDMVDGAWVRGVNMRTGYVTEDIVYLFRVLMDELGDGLYKWNHCNVYRELCHSVGFYPPHPKSVEFIHSDLFSDYSFMPANFQLCISLMSKKYYPEILGFNLSLEWNQLELMQPEALYNKVQFEKKPKDGKDGKDEKNKEIGYMNTVYYSMHIAVDNAASGHGRMAFNAVVNYLDRITDPKIKEEHWKRIWKSYVLYQRVPYTPDRDVLPKGKGFWTEPDTKPPDYEPDHEFDDLTSDEAKMVKLLQNRSPLSRPDLNDIYVDDQSFNYYLEDIDKDEKYAKKFLDALSESHWINKTEVSRSDIFSLFKGVWFGVFDVDDIRLWSSWIFSLTHVIPDPDPTTKLTVAQKMKKAIDMLISSGRGCGGHDYNYAYEDTPDKKISVHDLLEGGKSEPIMKALNEDKRLRDKFLVDIDRPSPMNSAWSRRVPKANNEVASQIAKDWINANCPLDDETKPKLAQFVFAANGKPTLFGEPLNIPTIAQFERGLFFNMMNIEDHVSTNTCFENAERFINRWTQWARIFAKQSTSSLDAPFVYSCDSLKDRMHQHYDLLQSNATKKIKSLCQNPVGFKDTRFILEQNAPLNLLEGAWLRGTPMASGPIERDQAYLFAILQELYGKGDLSHNRSVVYRATLEEVGIVPEDPATKNFASAYLAEAFSAPLFNLCVSQFSTMYYPEILGINLWMTWSSVEFMYEEALLEVNHIDPSYYRSQLSFSGISQVGHATYALKAVEEYMCRISKKGTIEKQKIWDRIWNAFIASKYQRYSLQTAVSKVLKENSEKSFEDRMLDMIQVKAEYARFNHREVCLGRKKLNDWFSEAFESRDKARDFLHELTSPDHHLVDRESPGESNIFKLMHFNNKMYGVFKDDEQTLWMDYIMSLSEEKNPTTKLPKSLSATPAIAVANELATSDNFEKALEYYPPRNEQWGEEVNFSNQKLKQLFQKNVRDIVNCLERSRSLRESFLNEIGSSGALNNAWNHSFPGASQRGITLAKVWCAAHNNQSPRFSKLGFWLPGHSDLELYVDELKANLPDPIVPQPTMTAFRKEIETDPVLYMYLEMMVQEAKCVKPRRACADTLPQLLDLMEYVMTIAPEYNKAGCPMSAIFDTSMATRHGYALFRYPPFNKHLKKILNAWGAFLKTDKSRYTLNKGPHGWYCKDALTKWDPCEFIIPPTGFKSWNDFFTRRFKKGMRPFDKTETILVSACEASFFSKQDNISMTSQFWIKEEPYALQYIFGEKLKDYAPKFVGGTIYQAFLHTAGYHRFHAPLKGKVVDKCKIDGLYYSEAEVQGVDLSGPSLSQGYLLHCAARGIVILESELIGLFAVVVVGMTEISGIEWAKGLRNGTVVNKGDELGNFSFGGSTHCLIFQKDAIESWLEGSLDDSGTLNLGYSLARINPDLLKKKSEN